MTRLGYLLPFLCALGWGANATTTIANPTLTPTTRAAQVETTVDKVSVSVKPSSPAVPSSTAATHGTAGTTITIPTKLPTVSAGATKLTTQASSGSQGAIQTTTVKTDTKAVGATSSGPRLGTTKDNTLNVTSPNDKSTQPTNLAKASTTVLNDSVVAVTSQPSITAHTTKPATELTATSLSFSRTSEQSNGTGVTNYSSTVARLSTVSPSTLTVSKTTAGSISDYTTNSLKDIIPTAIVPLNYNVENIEVNCKAEHRGSLVKINIKPSTNCVEYASMQNEETKEILKHICTALKPGYQPSKDKCHIELGIGIPGQLVILDAFVQSTSSPDDLFASLKHLKKDGSYLFQYDESKYEEEDLISIPLISAIVSLAVALLIIAAIYGCWHQRQTRKREQRLTEELQTMENGYHDNPTLEVMETSPEMQEKKGGPNGELGDSWIVPLDNLTREDLDEEEDTHL